MIFELSAAVFIAREEVKAGAAGGEKNGITLLRKTGAFFDSLFD